MRHRNGLYLTLFIGLCMSVTVSAQAETVTYQYGFDNAFVTNYTGSEDNVLVRGNDDASGASNYNYGGYDKLIVGDVGWSNTTKERSVLRFDLSSFAGKYVAINSVTLRLRKLDATSKEVNVYQVLSANSAWKEGTKVGTAGSETSCWRYRTYNTNSWAGSAGCGTSGTDYNATALATVSTSTAGFVDFTFSGSSEDLKNLIDLWSGDQGSNAGILLRATTESSTYTCFVSNENDAGTGRLDEWRPQLIIDYEPLSHAANLDIPSLFDFCFDSYGTDYTYYPPSSSLLEEHYPYFPTPHVENWCPDTEWEPLYDYQESVNGIISMLLVNTTAPINGTMNPDALEEVMDYLDDEEYYLDYVFADFEAEDKDEDTEEMVDLVRAHDNPAINTARIGNYDDFPGEINHGFWFKYDLEPQRIRTIETDNRHAFYLNSGLDVAMPSLYPYTAYKMHCTTAGGNPWDIDEIIAMNSDPGENIRYALFWGPLAKYTCAKSALPEGHLIIPWMGAYVYYSSYPADPPSKADCRALLQHVRLRGADGYYIWHIGEEPDLNTNYTDQPEYVADMYDNAWQPFDWFFDQYAGVSEVLNCSNDYDDLMASKTSGLIWSGIRKGNHCLFIFSNFDDQANTIPLPSDIENLPANSPSIPAGEHLIMDYVIGPLGYFKLDENTGYTVANTMSNLTSGTESGATWTTGKFGYALAFDGSDDYVSLGDQLDLGTDDRSISLWVKTSDTSSTGRCILSKGNSLSVNQHSIYLLPDGRLRAVMNINGTGRTITASSSVQINDDEWHHIAVTIDRSDKMSLYVDGSCKGTVDIRAVEDVDAQNSDNFYLGRTSGGDYFPGTIDEVKIYTGVLSAQEVFDEYAEVAFSARLDEMQGDDLYDDTLNENDGTISGGVIRETGGKSGGFLTLDDSNDDVSFGDVLDLGLKDRTISLWFKTDIVTSRYRSILSKGSSITDNQHTIHLLPDGRVRVLMKADQTYYTANNATALDDGEWHHIAVTIDRSDLMSLYVDGSLKDTEDISDVENSDFQTAYPLHLGRTGDGNIYYYFPGSIDEVKIYGRVLSGDEIEDLYEAGE